MKSENKNNQESAELFVNRELSWLTFSRRVLELAEDPETPLLERLKFAGIMGMIYDEFAMKRIGGLLRHLAKKRTKPYADGLTPRQVLDLARQELHHQCSLLDTLIERELRPAMAAAGIALHNVADLDQAQLHAMNQYFKNSVEPILTPLAVDGSHPFPFISTLGLNIALLVKDKKKKNPRFVRIKVPPNRPRWVPLPGSAFVPLEQVIGANISHLFPSAKEISCYYFRVIRGAKDDPWDRLSPEEIQDGLSPGSIIGMVTAELTARKFAGVTRLEVSADMPGPLQEWLAKQLEITADFVQPISGLLSAGDLAKLDVEDRPELRDPAHKPITHPRLYSISAASHEQFFQEIRKGDILLHHPYHNFDTSTLSFLRHAAHDPKVLAIKLTIYRTSADSPIVKALMEAILNGKQVAVLVEVTARFDEAPNIAWGRQLEQAGAHVVYGMEQLKTHVKLGLVIREEEGGIKRYVHVGTGNYHTGTARLYEDLGLLTADDELGCSVTAVFNELTGAIPSDHFGPLLVAPHNLRDNFTALIRREADHARAGLPCGIFAKMNQLQDVGMINELYLAGQAGVPVELNVRGLCCLKAGVVGLSENIKVFSTLGPFLEHSRIYRFANKDKPDYYIGSADWMERNLDRRMETIVPLADSGIKKELDAIISIYQRDNSTAWDMQPDGSYVRRRPPAGQARFSAQQEFIRLAEEQRR